MYCVHHYSHRLEGGLGLHQPSTIQKLEPLMRSIRDFQKHVLCCEPIPTRQGMMPFLGRPSLQPTPPGLGHLTFGPSSEPSCAASLSARSARTATRPARTAQFARGGWRQRCRRAEARDEDLERLLQGSIVDIHHRSNPSDLEFGSPTAQHIVQSYQKGSNGFYF